ncbi:MAG: hypothetical protein IPL70_15985 [Uliginosibacterium sp.]|nr:hypothetical protein [Uliginosibacterium sp.]
MRRTSPVSIYLDPEMKAYLQQIAGSRRMTLSDFCMHLMVKGLVSDELEQGVERIKDVFNGNCLGRCAARSAGCALLIGTPHQRRNSNTGYCRV